MMFFSVCGVSCSLGVMGLCRILFIFIEVILLWFISLFGRCFSVKVCSQLVVLGKLIIGCGWLLYQFDRCISLCREYCLGLFSLNILLFRCGKVSVLMKVCVILFMQIGWKCVLGLFSGIIGNRWFRLVNMLMKLLFLLNMIEGWKMVIFSVGEVSVFCLLVVLECRYIDGFWVLVYSVFMCRQCGMFCCMQVVMMWCGSSICWCLKFGL